MAEQRGAEAEQRGEAEHLLVRFEGNASKRWDGRKTEVPSWTVVRSGKRREDGLEVAEVHWGKGGKGGKGKKVWNCVVLEGEEEEAAAAVVPLAKRARKEGPGPNGAPERHGPGMGKLQLEQRLEKRELELRAKDIERREKEIDRRARELEKKAGLGKGKGKGKGEI